MTAKADTQTSPYETRPLNADDLEAVIAIDRSHSNESRRGFFESRLAAALHKPEDFVYVGCCAGNRLVGYVMARIVEGAFGKPGGRAALDAIGVDPEYRSKGIGHQLLDAAIKILRHKKVHELASQVNWSNHGLIGFFGEAGFELSPRTVLSRSTEKLPEEAAFEAEAPLEIDYSSPDSDAASALSRDSVPVRSMGESDIKSIIAIDRKNTGKDRSSYYLRKQTEIMQAAGARISLVAEKGGFPAGFIMARIDFGEFGRTSAEAVMDAIAVDPGYRGQGIGHALMSQLLVNLSGLQAGSIRTEIDWNDTALISYLGGMGFEPTQYVVLSLKL